ncbi:MAG: TlpA family protein disulfide reductase [Sphaerobacteraceae bacterium]|nr:MAG: TlpA family protein disulfide reductase [Sphaerobacteraceae bacterium]
MIGDEQLSKHQDQSPDTATEDVNPSELDQAEDPEENPESESRGSNLGAIALLLLAGSIALFAWAWSNERGDSSSGQNVEVGREAPDFTLPDLEGNQVALSDHRGEVVLINFWATWCPPCRVEMPDMEAVYREHRDEGFEILGVDQREPKELVEEFVTDRGFSWIFLLDEDFDVSQEYSATSIPRSILVDRDGTVAHVWRGTLTRSQLEQQLAHLGIGN